MVVNVHSWFTILKKPDILLFRKKVEGRFFTKLRGQRKQKMFLLTISYNDHLVQKQYEEIVI